jgi:hypothetical protein
MDIELDSDNILNSIYIKLQIDFIYKPHYLKKKKKHSNDYKFTLYIQYTFKNFCINDNIILYFRMIPECYDDQLNICHEKKNMFQEK